MVRTASSSPVCLASSPTTRSPVPRSSSSPPMTFGAWICNSRTSTNNNNLHTHIPYITSPLSNKVSYTVISSSPPPRSRRRHSSPGRIISTPQTSPRLYVSKDSNNYEEPPLIEDKMLSSMEKNESLSRLSSSNGKSSTSLPSNPSAFTLPDGFAYIFLNLVTVLWGTQHAVIKFSLLASPDTPGLLNFLRFTLASLLFLPWTPSPWERENREGIWKAGAELGFWMFLGYALQAIGLQYTTASRSGFLLYLNVKLVPLFAWLILGRRPTWDVWLSALVAFVGTTLLSFDGSLPNVGDLWSILAAAASAMFILRLENAAKSYSSTSSKELNSVTLWITSALCSVWAAFELGRQATSHNDVDMGTAHAMWSIVSNLVIQDWKQILYLGIVTTAICNWIQTLGQREVPAEKAALIYALDPVYGAVFARLLLGDSESLRVTGYIGATLVTSAAIFSTLYTSNKLKLEKTNEEKDMGEDIGIFMTFLGEDRVKKNPDTKSISIKNEEDQEQ